MTTGRPTDLELMTAAMTAAGLQPPALVQPADRWVELNRIRFHYLDWGNQQLPHVVLLHGGSLTAHTWDMAALLLRERYHLVALDQRGHGDSGWTPDDELDRDNGDLMLDDTRQFLEHLGYEHLVLVGMSMGGMNAIRYAARQPQRLDALGIVDVVSDEVQCGHAMVGSWAVVPQGTPRVRAANEPAMHVGSVALVARPGPLAPMSARTADGAERLRGIALCFVSCEQTAERTMDVERTWSVQLSHGSAARMSPVAPGRRECLSWSSSGVIFMPALQASPPLHCPKCRGYVIVERDQYGTYGSCLSCGYVQDVLVSGPVDFAAEEAARPVRTRRRQPSHGNHRL